MPSIRKKSRPFIIPVFLPQEGCPHRCIFCDQQNVTGLGKTPPLTQAGVWEAIEKFAPFCGPGRGRTEIAFYGGNFLGLDPDRAEELLEAAALLVREGRADGIRLSTRPDTISDATLGLCKKFPVAVIEMGVQSMDDAVLKACNRGHTADCAAHAARRIKAAGFCLGVHLMVGLPAETLESLVSTAQAVAGVKPDFVRIHPTLVISGSPLEKIMACGDYVPLGLDEAVARTLVVYEILAQEGVTVARMGLFTPQGQSCDSVMAGPVHPAFGHLVLCADFLKKASKILSENNARGGKAVLAVNPASISRMSGLKNDTIQSLKGAFGLGEIKVVADSSAGTNEVSLKCLAAI